MGTSPWGPLTGPPVGGRKSKGIPATLFGDSATGGLAGFGLAGWLALISAWLAGSAWLAFGLGLAWIFLGFGLIWLDFYWILFLAFIYYDFDWI